MVKISKYLRKHIETHTEGIKCPMEKAEMLLFTFKLSELCDDYFFASEDIPIVERYGCFLIRSFESKNGEVI